MKRSSVQPADQSTTTDKDIIDTLQMADSRLQAMQNNLQQLAPKAQAWDVMCTVVAAMTPSQPYGCDDLPSRIKDAVSTLQRRGEAQ